MNFALAGAGQPENIPGERLSASMGRVLHLSPQLGRWFTAEEDESGEAVVLLSASRAIPQWVKIRNVDGFTGSFWQGGVGGAHVDVTNSAYTITGSAYGINSSNPNKVITTDFKITAEC